MELLKKFLQPGDTVYGIVKSVSRSGMSRRIKFYTISKPERADEKTRLVFLTGYMAHVLGYKMGDDGCINVSGCGMDMVFATVYNLGRTLWPKGDGKYTRYRNGSKEVETDGGYLLQSECL